MHLFPPHAASLRQPARLHTYFSQYKLCTRSRSKERRLVGAPAGAGQLSGAVLQAMPPLPQITLFPYISREYSHTIHHTIHTTYTPYTDDEKKTTTHDETQNLSGAVGGWGWG